MLVYASLSIYERYRDRYRMFMAMCDHGVRVRMLLLHGEHPKLEAFPDGFERLSIPENTTFFTRRAVLRKLIAPAPKGERTVVHDSHLMQMGQALRHRGTFARSYPSVRNVLALYSPTISFLLQGHWWRPGGQRASLAEIRHYAFTFLPHIVAEFVCCHLADGVTGNSQEIVDDLGHYYGVHKAKRRLIPAEIDTAFFAPGPSRRESLNLPVGRQVVLFAGNFQPRKGVDTLLHAFDLVNRRLPDCRLVLLGRFVDPVRPWFERLLDSLPCRRNVELHPYADRERLVDYYRSVDLLVCSSRHEGSPRVIKEAMACGTPVVATRIPGAVAIDPRAEAVEFVPVGQPEAMAAAICRLLTSPALHNARSNAGLRVVRETLTPHAIARRYLDFYDDLFNARPPL